ncbi:nucleotide-diphospho-sugar transferase [Fennellomyces sp. T-0311]|nr:nucleotide-diphospho-sugar transferase [Fennellomyces sp. T-0311]
MANKRLLLLTSAFLWCIGIIYFFFSPKWPQDEENDFVDAETETFNEQTVVDDGPHAYVTFLCDDAMAEATQVLVHSLVVNAKAQNDIVVLVLPPVTQNVRERLRYLGARIEEIEQVKYPWKSSATATKEGYNKACRYSKLHLWNLTKYQKVVFLDADTLVLQPIEELFERPQLSAAMDAGGVMNTGVFVAEPSKAIFEDMMNVYEKAPSYNRGDQGFLNWYFNQTSMHILPGYYNLMIKFMHFSTLVASHVYRNTVKVVHFTSEIKPWNFYYQHHREWKDNYDTYIFDQYIKASRDMQSRLIQGNLLPTSDSSSITPEFCQAPMKSSNYLKRYPSKAKFTVVLTSSIEMEQSWEEYIDSLLALLTSSADDSSSKVEKIFVVRMSGVSLNVPTEVFGIPVEWIRSSDSPLEVANRINTEATLLLDDKIIPAIHDLEFGFRVWQSHPETLVGFDASTHRKDDSVVAKTTTGRYSIVRSTAMFIKSDWLYSFTCLLPGEIHTYLHAFPQCTDVALNMFVSGTTSMQPLLLTPSNPFYILDGSKSSDDLSMCIPDLREKMNGRLLYNDAVVSRTVQSNIQHSKPQMWRSLFAVNM